MFKFGFSSPNTEEKKYCLPVEDEKNLTCSIWFPSKEILPSESLKIWKDRPITKDIDVFKVREESVLCVKTSALIDIIKELQTDENIKIAENNHSDLVPAKYEGGLKVWECTTDLANILEPSMISGKMVLDLGCGVGLLGILALKMGANSVHFQDYNNEVLRYATIPNVKLNTNPELFPIIATKFFSGDWGSFAALVEHSYDLIISSETIYNSQNYLKLHNTIRKVLKKTGMALIGAKTYYFGVGGSTRQFEKLIKSEGIFNTEVVWKCSEGVQREILKLTFKSSSCFIF